MNIGQRMNHLGEILFKPAAGIEPPSDRRRARLLSQLILGCFFSLLLPAFGFGLSEKMPLMPFYFILTMLGITYFISRSKHFLPAAYLMTASFYCMSIWVIVSMPRFDSGIVAITMIWMILPFLVTSMIYTHRATFFIAILAFSSILVLPLFKPDLEYRFIAPTWSFMMTWAILHTIYLLHAYNVEQDRIHELKQAYRQLEIEIEERQLSEERLRFTITGGGGSYWDEILDPAAPFDEQPGIVSRSSMAKQLLGFSENDDTPDAKIIWHHFVLPEDQPKRSRLQQEHFEGRSEYLDHEYRIRRKDGEIRWIHGRSRILRDENDAPIRWIGIDWDITDRKLIEEELQQHRRHLEKMVAERTAELQARSSQLQLLNEITATALKMPDFNEMLQAIADRLGAIIGADNCYITLWDEENQCAIPTAATGDDRHNYIHSAAQVQPGELSLTASTLRAGTALAVDDVLNSAHVDQKIAASYPSKSVLGLPLISGTEKLGAALIAFLQPHQFTQEEIQFGEQAAAQIALAIAKNRALDAERQARQRMETLQNASLALSAALELQEAFDVILSSLQKVIPYDSASVQKLEGDSLIIIGGIGFPNLEELIGVSFNLNADDNPNSEVINTRTTMILDDVQSKYANFEREPHRHAGIRSWMGVPLIARGEIIGMIALDRKATHSFTQFDTKLAASFAAQAAITIQNAELFAETQSYATEMEEKVADRTEELQIIVNAMAGREVRMAELKKVIRVLRQQLKGAGIEPIADDPLKSGR